MLSGQVALDYQDNGKLLFRGSDSELVTAQNFNSVMGYMLRDAKYRDSVTRFVDEVNIPLKTFPQAVDAEGYNDEANANLSGSLLSYAMPVFTKLFPQEMFEDGFYGFGCAVSENVIAAQYATTYQEFIVSLFGQWRKDIARITPHSNWDKVAWASLFARHLPLDWVVGYLSDHSFRSPAYGIVVEEEPLAYLLGRLTRYDIRRFLHSHDDEDPLHLVDVSRMLYAMPDRDNISWEGNRTIQELHDFMSLTTQGASEETPFVYPDCLTGLDSHEVDGYKIHLPACPAELVKIGKDMDNCVGSFTYMKGVLTGTGYVIQFIKGREKLLMELGTGSEWKVRQFVGHKNAPLPAGLYNKISSRILLEVNK